MLEISEATRPTVPYRSDRRQKRLRLSFHPLPEKVQRIIEARRHRKRLARSKPRRRCRYCGVGLSKRTAEIDHKLPKSRGGTNDPRNLVLCCRHCNLSKGDFTPEEWAASILGRPPRADRLPDDPARRAAVQLADRIAAAADEFARAMEAGEADTSFVPADVMRRVEVYVADRPGTTVAAVVGKAVTMLFRNFLNVEEVAPEVARLILAGRAVEPAPAPADGRGATPR